MVETSLAIARYPCSTWPTTHHCQVHSGSFGPGIPTGLAMMGIPACFGIHIPKHAGMPIIARAGPARLVYMTKTCGYAHHSQVLAAPDHGFLCVCGHQGGGGYGQIMRDAHHSRVCVAPARMSFLIWMVLLFRSHASLGGSGATTTWL